MEPQHNTTGNGKQHSLKVLALAALGVVFGDIGTSPLYAIGECFHGEYGIEAAHDNILGVLSLMFWALTIIVSPKYLTFILRADNRGEGGVIALTVLLGAGSGMHKKRRYLFLTAGIFAGRLLDGDGMITSAISVLSAAEGLKIITPSFEPYIIPATMIILAGLFLLQHRGTARVGCFSARSWWSGLSSWPSLVCDRLLVTPKYLKPSRPGTVSRS